MGSLLAASLRLEAWLASDAEPKRQLQHRRGSPWHFACGWRELCPVATAELFPGELPCRCGARAGPSPAAASSWGGVRLAEGERNQVTPTAKCHLHAKLSR